MFHSDDLTKLAGIVDGILTPEEKSKMGLLPSDDTALVNRVKSLVEDDMATSMTLEPLGRMVDKRTLYPWQGKESDSEIAFNFEDVMDAQRLYDFVVNTGLLESGEIRMHVSEHQVSVHFGSHVRVMKPEVLQAALLAYYDYVEDIPGNDEAFESLVQELDDILTEKTKVSGAPKKRAKGNPFHGKRDGKFSGPDGIAADKGGSFSSKKTKLKFAGEKKSKAGDKVVHFASTKRPCGRKARRTGKDIRCWDGEKGKGFPESVQAGIDLSGIIRKQILGEEITDDDLRGMVRAIDYVIDAAAMIESRLREDVELEEATVTYKRSYPPKIDDAMKKWREGGMWDNLPKIYIDYHKKFASEELKKLARKYKLKVLSSRMIPSGDLDGMMLLQAKVELPGGKNITIKWLDSHGNGQWMKDTGHGHAILFVSDLQEDVELDEAKGRMVMPSQVKVGHYVRLGRYVMHVTKKPYIDPNSMSSKEMYVFSGKIMDGPGKSKGMRLTLPSESDSKVEVLPGYTEDVELDGSELIEEYKVGPNCKKVIGAFLDKKAMEGGKLTTDGKRLDGNWSGGRGIAQWDKGKIRFNDLGSKAAQTVERSVKKAAPKNWLAEGEARPFDLGTELSEGKKMTRKQAYQALKSGKDLSTGMLDALGISMDSFLKFAQMSDKQTASITQKYIKVLEKKYGYGKQDEDVELSESEVVNREAVLIYPVDLQRFHQFSTGPKDASNWQAKTYVITGKPKSRGKMTSVPVKSLTGKKDVIDLPSKEKIKAYTRMNLEKVFKTKEVDPLTLKPGDKVIRSAQWGDSVVRISKKSESVPNVLGKDGMAVQTYGVFIIGHPSQVGKSADRTYLRRENVLRIVGEIKEDVELDEGDGKRGVPDWWLDKFKGPAGELEREKQELLTKAFKAMPGSIVQKRISKKIEEIEREIKKVKKEDVELDEGDVYNVLGRETVKGSGEAQKLAARIRKEIEKSMPPGAVLKCDVEKSFGKKLISIATALEKDINKVPNQIRQNDRAYQTFFVYGVNEDDSLQDKMEATIAQGGTLLVKPELGSHMAFGSVKFGWRKKKGTPEQIVKHFGNYFKKVKKVIQDNKGMIPESVEESRINWSDFGVPQGVISEMVEKPGPAKMHS